MTKHAAAALIVRGRSGDEAAFGQLFQEVSPALRHSAASELAELAALTDPDEVVHWTRKESWKIFATFEGSTAEELQVWLSGILLERIRLDRQRNPDDAETLVQRNSFKPGQTVRSGVDPLELADCKTELAQDKHDNETLSYGSVDPHATVAGPPKSPVAGEMPIKKFGDYDILQTIARGGMGVVYKARQRRLNRVVALKMILAGQFADQDDVERFYLEAESAAQLRHPNIVGIHEVGECEGQHYFSMDYIEGESLAERVRERPLSPLVAARFVKAISGAMAYAHAHGVLHRDLKPSNVMIDQDEVPLITDFGLAKRMEDELKLTVAGSILGTPSYMPPEQAAGKIDELSVRSDIYSLGAILYELLTGRPPFGAAHPFETLQQVIEVEPVLPRLQNASVPVDLETICLKCLQKEQERRYASGEELADELERFIQGEPILARPIGVVERVWRWCRRNPKIAASISMTVASILLALVATTFLYVRAEAARAQTANALGKAEASRDQLLAAINDLYTSWGDVKLLNEPGFEEVRAELLGTARKLHRETLQLLGDDPKIRQELGAANFRLAKMMFQLKAPQESLKPLESARKIQERLLEEMDPNDTEHWLHLEDLGDTLNFTGEVLGGEVLQEVGAAADVLERLDEAALVYDEAVRVRRELVQRSAGRAEFRRQLINSQMNSALVRQRMADFRPLAEAVQYYEQARYQLNEVQQGRQALLRESPDDRKLAVDLARGYFNMANIGLELDDFVTTRQHLEKAIHAFDSILHKDPNSLQNQFHRVLCVILAGDVPAEQLQLLDSGPGEARDTLVAEAEQHYSEAQVALEQMVAASATVPKYRAAIARVHIRLGELYYLIEQDDTALVHFEKAVTILDPLIDDFPDYLDLLEQARESIEDIKSFEAEPAIQEAEVVGESS